MVETALNSISRARISDEGRCCSTPRPNVTRTSATEVRAIRAIWQQYTGLGIFLFSLGVLSGFFSAQAVEPYALLDRLHAFSGHERSEQGGSAVAHPVESIKDIRIDDGTEYGDVHLATQPIGLPYRIEYWHLGVAKIRGKHHFYGRYARKEILSDKLVRPTVFGSIVDALKRWDFRVAEKFDVDTSPHIPRRSVADITHGDCCDDWSTKDWRLGQLNVELQPRSDYQAFISLPDSLLTN